jgi:hypothetical protein
MIHLVMQGQALHLAAKSCPHLDLGQNEAAPAAYGVQTVLFDLAATSSTR